MSEGIEADSPKRWSRPVRVLALAACGLATAAAGVWLGRTYFAEALIRQALAKGDIRADLKVRSLDFGGASIGDLRLGAPDSPDFWAQTARFTFDWSAVAPRLGKVTIENGGLRLRLGESAAEPEVSLSSSGRASVPDWDVSIRNFHLIGETPFGAFDAVMTGEGRLHDDFHGAAHAPPRDLRGPGGGAQAFEAKLAVNASSGRLTATLAASADRLYWGADPHEPQAQASGVRAAAAFAAPLDLARGALDLTIAADRAQIGPTLDAADARVTAQAVLGAFAANFTPTSFGGAFQARTARTAIAGVDLDGATASGPLDLNGDLQARAWRGEETAVALDNVRVTHEGEAARINGTLRATARGAGFTIVAGAAPLDLELFWGVGFRVAPAGGRCMALNAERLEAAGVTFAAPQAALCPAVNGVFARADKQGALTGGFALEPIAWRGRMGGGEPALLKAARVEGALSGTQSAPMLSVAALAPAFSAAYPQDRTVTVDAAQISAAIALNAQWALTGDLRGVNVDDSSLPGSLAAFNAVLRGAPDRTGEAVFRIERGQGRALARARDPLFHTLVVRDVSGALRAGQASADGALALETAPGAVLGAFTLHHNTETSAGEAQVTARDLAFTNTLQPYDISELGRGVIDHARGPIDAALTARWDANGAVTTGSVDLKALSFATAALGPIEGASGTVNFDDLAQMHTPPGQTITIARMNPGVVVENGEISFQIEDQTHVALERARWPFAAGVLSIEPTRLRLDAEETRLSLLLSQVDVGTLIEQLNVSGLSATGEVEGRFPLIFTATKGRIEHGRLVAAPGGGLISYRGDVGPKTGPAALAFDALRSFRYESLSLDIDGDIDGELVSAIRFSGENREPLDPGNSLIPLKVTGIPFRFTVTVQAPFRALAQNAAGFGDARFYLRALEAERAGEAPAE